MLSLLLFLVAPKLYSEETLKPIYTNKQIARFSTLAETSLRNRVVSPKVFMGILYLNQVIEDKNESVLRTFRDVKKAPTFYYSKYTEFEQAYEKLNGDAPYTVSGGIRNSSQLFLDVLIMTGHPKAVAIGTLGTKAKDSVFNVYEWYENIPGRTLDRRNEFLRDLKQGEANLGSLVARLVQQSQYDPDLKKLLEWKIYPYIGFSPEESEEDVKKVIPEFFQLENDKKNQASLNEVSKKIDAIEKSLKENLELDRAAKETKKESAENTDINRELHELQSILPKLYARDRELSENATLFRGAAQMISNTATLLRLTGYDDQSGHLRATVNMATGAARMAQLTSNYLKLSEQNIAKGQTTSNVDSFSFSMDIMGVFFDTAVSMTPGMSAESQMMMSMQKMLEQLREHIDQQFEILHYRLDRLEATLDEEFRKQSLMIAQNQSDIQSLHSKLSALSLTMNQQTNLLLNALEAGFDEISQKEVKDCLLGLIPWRVCRNHLVDHAINNSSNELRLFNLDYRRMAISDILQQLRRNIYKNVSFLEHIGRNYFQMNAASDLNPRMINPQVWAVATNQYLDVIEKSNEEELIEELPYIDSLLNAYNRYRNPLSDIFKNDKKLFLSLFSEYINTYNEYLEGIAHEAQEHLNLQGFDHIDVRKILKLKKHKDEYKDLAKPIKKAPENEADFALYVRDMVMEGAKIRQAEEEHLTGDPLLKVKFPKTTRLMSLPGPLYGGFNDLLIPENLEAPIDQRWLIAERLGLVSVQPYLIMDKMSARDKTCFFGIAYFAKSTETRSDSQPVFQGVVGFVGKHIKDILAEPYNGTYNQKSCLHVWPKVAKHFLRTAKPNDFTKAKVEYNWGRAQGGWQLEVENLAWLWNVWSLKEKPKWDEKQTAAAEANREIIRNGAPEHRRRNVGVQFTQYQIFSHATMWEGIEFLEKQLPSKIDAHLKIVAALVNEHLLKRDRSNILKPELKSKLLMIGQLIQNFLILGYSNTVNFQANNDDFVFFSSLKYFENPPPCVGDQCPDYVQFLFKSQPEALSKTQSHIFHEVLKDNWQEPIVFLEIRRRLVAIRELILRLKQNEPTGIDTQKR